MLCAEMLTDGTIRLKNFEDLQTFQSPNVSSVCNGFILTQPTDPIQPTLPDPALAAEFFMYGLTLVLSTFFVSYVVGAIQKVIRS